MASLIESIKSNDPELTDLRLTEIPEAYCSDISEMIDALKDNKVIEYVRFDRDFLPAMKPEECPTFFNAVGALPNLKEALIWHASIPVKVLADFVQHARGLENLQLGCMDLEGSEEDFQLVSDALREHPTLKVFAMSDFSLNDDSVSIDGLIETLATLPCLERVKLEVTYAKRSSLVGNEAAAKQVKVSLTGRALGTLCTSKSLQELHLSRLKLGLDDFKALAESIQTAPALKTLALPHCGVDDDGCSAIAVAVGQSSTLESVNLSCNHISDEGCISIATALKGNSSVKFLRLWGNVKISNAGFDALVDMLEHNCVLERVPLMAPLDYKNRIDDKLVQNRSSTNKAA